MAGLYADIEFSEQNYFQMAMNCAISGLCDPELPVQVDSVFALSCFMEACKGMSSPMLLVFLYLSFLILNPEMTENISRCRSK